jgi:hypothetical protein
VLGPQVDALGGEIIVGDGHGEALQPGTAEASERLRWIRKPGASVFELRALAAGSARGEIIALTEDHCLVADDWCARVLEAFAAAPEAQAAWGPILNGSRDSRIDWANYFHTFGAFVPPCDPDQRFRCPPIANVAFRREVFPEEPPAPGWIELELSPRLLHAGRFRMHGPMQVTHVQSHGFWKTLRSHFDNGRSTTGLHRVPLGSRQFPWRLYRETVRLIGGGETIRPTVRASLPCIFLLSCCHALGEITGILAGPGNSPARLR